MNTLTPESLMEQLHWRYATKRFDLQRKVPQDTWNALESALVLSPSAFGLQPWKCVVITDDALRARLREASFNQPQVTECSHLVVFACKTTLDEAYIDHYLARTAEVRQVSQDSLKAYRKMMVNSLLPLSSEEKNQWMSRQTYIALGFLLQSAAMLGIDACPMEGINRDQYDTLLNLAPDHHALCVAAVGYRNPLDLYSQMAKVRFPAEELIDHRG